MRKLATVITLFHGALYRLLRGRLPDSRHMLILSTTGRKSGTQRQIPLLYGRAGNDWILAASNAGRNDSPAWWLNLQAQPEATIQVRGPTIQVCAELIGPAGRDRLWADLVTIFPVMKSMRPAPTAPSR